MNGEPLIPEGPTRRIQAARPAWVVHLRAVAGQTGNQGAPAMMNDVRPPASVVVLGWGINDAIQHKDVAPMRGLIEKLRLEGASPILTGPAPYAGSLASWFRVQAAIQKMAIDTETPWVNWGVAPIRTVDGVHPDQASSNRLVDSLITALDQECAKRSPAIAHGR